MAKCYVTGLGPKAGNNRSHSLQASRRTWKPNLQKVRIKDEKGHVIRVYVSTRALRTGLKYSFYFFIKRGLPLFL